MTPILEVAFAEHVAELLKHGAEEPNYNQTLRDIAKRQAFVTAKEVGAVTLPLAAGVLAGKGYERFMKHRGGAGPGARKVMQLASIPAVGLAVGAAYRGAKRLKEQEFGRIHTEEVGKYDQRMKEYKASLKREPQSEGLS